MLPKHEDVSVPNLCAVPQRCGTPVDTRAAGRQCSGNSSPTRPNTKEKKKEDRRRHVSPPSRSTSSVDFLINSRQQLSIIIAGRGQLLSLSFGLTNHLVAPRTTSRVPRFPPTLTTLYSGQCPPVSKIPWSGLVYYRGRVTPLRVRSWRGAFTTSPHGSEFAAGGRALNAEVTVQRT
jgi:hypothetical protein